MTAARTGRPPLTSRDQLLAAAHEIGFADLTVGKVTEACGVKYSTFYRHFKTFAALQAALVDEVLDSAHIPQHDNWEAQLAQTVSEFVTTLATHPGMAETIASLPERPAWLTRAHDRAVDVMASSGFAPDAATEGVEDVLIVAGLGPGRYRPWMTGLLIAGLSIHTAFRPDRGAGTHDEFPDRAPGDADV